MSRQAVSEAIKTVSNKNKKNCVRGRAESLMWDGTERLENFFQNAVGANDGVRKSSCELSVKTSGSRLPHE